MEAEDRLQQTVDPPRGFVLFPDCGRYANCVAVRIRCIFKQFQHGAFIKHGAIKKGESKTFDYAQGGFPGDGIPCMAHSNNPDLLHGRGMVRNILARCIYIGYA